MALGIGFVCWAMFNLWPQDNYSTDVGSSDYLSATNYVVDPGEFKIDDTGTVETVEQDKPLYPEYPAEGDKIGSLSIPALERKLPIFQGTGVNELRKGVGHFNQSVLPGEEDNCVLSGHRETSFRQLDKLKIGDLLVVETSAGIFTYKVSGIRIVDKDDRTVIVPTEHAVLTMTTCYPFNYVGPAPDRYIVSADLLINK